MIWYGQSIATGGGSEEPLDKILIEKYHLDRYKGTAIECGANDGLFLSNCLNLEQLGWKVINIEASYPNYANLIINRKNSTNYFYALSDIDYKILHIEHFDGDNGGVDKSSEYKTEVSSRYNLIGVSVVATITYETLVKEPIDLLVLDTEGYELKALTGMLPSKYLPKILCIEHTHCGLDSINNLLKDKYNLDWSDSLNATFLLK